MLGVEFVTDRKEKTPAKVETAILFEKLKGMSWLSFPFPFFLPPFDANLFFLFVYP